jgi:ABC-type transporter Mla subunit MlaD
MHVVFQTAWPTRWAADLEGYDMSFMDKAKDALEKAVDEHGDKISDGIDKAADFADDKTGGKYSDKIDQGVDKAKDALDKLDGKDDDLR